MRNKLLHSAGFTLIELLITISIILLVTGGGIAGFVNFNDRQNVQTTVKEIQELMRAAQVKARSGEDANDCDNPGTLVVEKLKGYEVTLAGNAAILNRICYDPVSLFTTATERSRSTINSTLTVTLPPVTFLALKGGVDTGGADVTVTISGQYSGLQYQFQVLQTGEITEGAFTAGASDN